VFLTIRRSLCTYSSYPFLFETEFFAGISFFLIRSEGWYCRTETYCVCPRNSSADASLIHEFESTCTSCFSLSSFVRNDFQSFGLLVFSPLTINCSPHPLLIRSTLVTEFSLFISVIKITCYACPVPRCSIFYELCPPKEGGISCRL